MSSSKLSYLFAHRFPPNTYHLMTTPDDVRFDSTHDRRIHVFEIWICIFCSYHVGKLHIQPYKCFFNGKDTSIQCSKFGFSKYQWTENLFSSFQFCRNDVAEWVSQRTSSNYYAHFRSSRNVAKVHFNTLSPSQHHISNGIS